MSGLRTVTLDWAISSKAPGGVEYGIQRSSQGPKSHRKYLELITAIDPGSPSSTVTEGPAVAPWVSLMTWDDAGRDFIGVCITERGHGLDSANRPITATRFFALDARDYLETRCTYRMLWHAVRDLEPPADGSGPIAVQLPVGSSRDLAPAPASMDVPGFRWLAGVAALLLDTKVVITDYPGTGADRALEQFEAIAALLPFGYRAKLNLSTWTRAPASEARLMFGPSGVRGNRSPAVEVSWALAEAIPPDRLSVNARGYHDALLQLREEFGGDGPIVSGLRAAGEVGRPAADAGRAQQVVSRLDLVSVTHKLISNAERGAKVKKSSSVPVSLAREILGDGTLQDVREVVASVDYASMRDERRTAFVEFLMLNPDPRALENLPESWWDPVVRRMARNAHTLLARQPKSAAKVADFVQRFYTAAERASAQNGAAGGYKYDALWCALFTAGSGDDATAAAMAKLVLDLWSSWPGRYRFDLPHTGSLLAERADLCRALLDRECDLPGQPIPLLSIVLNRAGPGSWILPLRLVLPDYESDLSTEEGAAFAADHPDNAVLMLRLAGWSGRTDLAVEAVGEAFLHQAAAQPSNGKPGVRAAMARLIQQGLHPDASMWSHAVLDIAAILIYGDVTHTHLSTLRDHRQFTQYGSDLLDATANGFPATCQSTVALTLTRAACAKPDGVPPWTDAVLRALLTRGQPETRRQVAEVVGAMTVKNKRLSADVALGPEFWRLVLDNADGDKRRLIQVQIYNDLSHAVKAVAETARLAHLCWRALELNCPTSEILRHLAKWRWRNDFEHAQELFRLVDGLMGMTVWAGPGQAELAVIGGVWGSGPAKQFHDRVLQDGRSRIEQARAEAMERRNRHELQLRQADLELGHAKMEKHAAMQTVERSAQDQESVAAEQLSIDQRNAQYEADEAIRQIQRELEEKLGERAFEFEYKQSEIRADADRELQRITASWDEKLNGFAETKRREASVVEAIDAEFNATELDIRRSLAQADEALGRADGGFAEPRYPQPDHSGPQLPAQSPDEAYSYGVIDPITGQTSVLPVTSSPGATALGQNDTADVLWNPDPSPEPEKPKQPGRIARLNPLRKNGKTKDADANANTNSNANANANADKHR
jgi:hypothetical protein